LIGGWQESTTNRALRDVVEATVGQRRLAGSSKPAACGRVVLPTACQCAQLRRVLAANALLRDPERRARYDRAAMRSHAASQAAAEATNTRNSSGAVRIPDLTVRFKARGVSA